MIPPHTRFEDCWLVKPAKSPRSINATEAPLADNAAADKANEGKKMPKRRPKYLDEKIKAEEAKKGKTDS